MTVSEITDLLAQEALHIRHAILAAPLLTDPSPHTFVESVFSPTFYERILAEFPTRDEAWTRWMHGGDPSLFFGNYDRRREVNFPLNYDRLTPRQQLFWAGMVNFFCGRDFANILIERFDAFLTDRFGPELHDPTFFETRMRGAMMLNKHDPGYYLGPHTDRFEKIVTCVFYLPEHSGLEHLGTTLYTPKEPGLSCRGIVHHDPAGFVPRQTIPFRPNSVFIFARSDVLFHGVERLTESAESGSQRPGFQMQFWER